MQSYFLKSLFNTLLCTGLLLFFSEFAQATSYFNSPKDTTVVVKKDIYPKIENRKKMVIEGRNYIFATINGKKGMVALDENFLGEMCRAAGVGIADFLGWNDMRPTDAIEAEQVYYLEKKNNKASDVANHVLLPTESLWSVSQKYAVRYKYLLRFNRMKDTDKAKTGLVVWLQTKRPKSVPPEVRKVTPIVASFDNEDNEPADPELMAEWNALKESEALGEESEFSGSQGTEKEVTGVIVEEKSKNTTTPTKVEKANNTTTNSAKKEKYHIVQEGESLYDISIKYNLLMTTLKSWNNLNDFTTYTGQRLLVSKPTVSQNDKIVVSNNPATIRNNNVRRDTSNVLLPIPEDFSPVAPSSGTADYHIIAKGENLWKISQKYGVSFKDLIRWNGFITGDNVDVGTKIVLKESLAYPEGSRETATMPVNTNSGSSSSTQVETPSEFRDPSLVTDPAIQNQNTENIQFTREQIIEAGGDPNKAGKPGYDEMGFPIPGDVVMTNESGTKNSEIVKKTQIKEELYVIQAGDQLRRIAQKFGVTTKELMEWNPKKIQPNRVIYKGDTILVSPPKKTTAIVADNSSQVLPPEHYGAGYHAVQPKENIYEISEKYGVLTTNLRKWNNLSESTKNFTTGTKLIVDKAIYEMMNKDSQTETASNSTVSKTPSYVYHTVTKGETLFSIANSYKISTAQLREWNNRQGDLVYDGEKLIVGIE